MKDDNKVVGDLWVYLIEKDRMASVAVRLSKGVHGCGYGTEALMAITRFCFEHTELRQAVSRWETGETIPNTETLKLLSKLFHVTINTLLGAPQQLICQCCGMPLGDDTTSKDPDGSFNEDYCKWCYADGEFKYSSKEQLIDFCVEHMATEEWPAEQVRAHMESVVPGLKHWK